MKRILVTGAGGFIGGHLVQRLAKAHPASIIRAVDIKPLQDWYQVDQCVDNRVADLRRQAACEEVTEGVGSIYNLAADMGGMGYIETHKVDCMRSVLINTHLLEAAASAGVEHYFYASSACVYAADKQATGDVVYLKESDAYPAMPEDGYGWEKLFSERMCQHYAEEKGIKVRVARFHNVYGPHGAWIGGREKAPAAICRKIANIVLSGNPYIEIWGDGEQKRSFMFIDDCIEGISRICSHPIEAPINLGTSETVTINQLVDIVSEIAQVETERVYDPGAPKGVRSRSSDNSEIKRITGWEPSIPLREGLERTYRWIFNEMQNAPIDFHG